MSTQLDNQNEEPSESAHDSQSLESVLISKGLISSDQLRIAQKIKKDSNSSDLLQDVLVDLGFITEHIIADTISQMSGVKRFDLKTLDLDAKLIIKVPKEIALKTKAIAVKLEGEKLYVATSDVYNIIAIDHIKRYFPKNTKVEAVYATETQINEIINNFYSYDMTIDGILKEIERTEESQVKKNLELNDYVNPTVRLVDAILIDSIKKGASDIHLEPDANFIRVRYRIDSHLSQILSFHKNCWSSLVVRIKIMSNMNIAESRIAQDGRISYDALGRKVDFRVATHPTIHGENIVLRILDKQTSLVSLDSLGWHPKNLETLKKSLMRPEGIIIVTGPTGSGKTTTLYSILNHISNISRNIMTLEDPVEYQLPLIRQTNIKDAAGLNFSDGIRSIMRQDPDVIFVGEVRDAESAEMAIRAAMTGHQVYTTLHTNDAISTINRLLDIGITTSSLSGSICCIIAQRLIRKLCIYCKEEKTLNEKDLKLLRFDANLPNPTIYQHKGCEKCNFSGYKGRTAINEIIYVDANLDELIATSATRSKMLEYLVSNGFLSMADDAVDKVLKGISDIDEIISNVNMISRI
jgi:type IV pilus assembly protein PilB